LKTRALLVADRILAFTDVVGRENVIAGTDCGLGAASIRKSPGPSRATARGHRK